MIFNTPWFIAFLIIYYAMTWLTPGPKTRYALLLIACAIFHTHFAGPSGVAPIIVMAVSTYYIAGPLSRAQGARRMHYLLLGLAVPVAGLIWYKYRGFFGMGQVGAMPLAISFFTFEFAHYLTDIYKGSQPIRNAGDFTLFSIYFPSIVSGPIKRYQPFTESLKRGIPHPMHNPLALKGAGRVLLGFSKKMLVADNCSVAIALLEKADQWNTSSVVALIVLLTIRILFDFSGYSDIAIGLAEICGIEVPQNFNFPYAARNIQDFWRRWHMSLSSWIRDYIYIPLGGSRAAPWRRALNLLLAMGLCGLWHGAAWNFVLWGLYHGMGMSVHALWAKRFPAPEGRDPLRFVFSWALTLVFVAWGWLLFTYPLAKVIEISRHLF